jgi:hypothetical protein
MHDLDDHGWQFLDGRLANLTDAAVVALDEVVRLDKTVLDIARMPPGSWAWRAKQSDEWVIEVVN